LGSGRLSPAVGAPHRLGDRCRTGLRGGSRSSGIRNRRKKRGHARYPADQRFPVSLGHRRGAALRGRNKEKFLPAEFISADGFGITEAARRYLAPLIVGEAYPHYKDGLPDYVKLQNAAAPKKLAGEFAV